MVAASGCRTRAPRRALLLSERDCSRSAAGLAHRHEQNVDRVLRRLGGLDIASEIAAISAIS